MGLKVYLSIFIWKWEGREVINEWIKLSVPKLVVILHYVEFIMSFIERAQNEVESMYHLGSSYFVSCTSPYKYATIRFWKTSNGKKIPTSQGIRFNE